MDRGAEAGHHERDDAGERGEHRPRGAVRVGGLEHQADGTMNATSRRLSAKPCMSAGDSGDTPSMPKAPRPQAEVSTTSSDQRRAGMGRGRC